MKTYNTVKTTSKPQIISLRVPPDLMKQLQRHAELSDLSISEYIRRSIKVSFTKNKSEIVSHSAKALIKDEYLITMLSFVIGSTLAQTVRLTDHEKDLANYRAQDFRDALQKYL